MAFSFQASNSFQASKSTVTAAVTGRDWQVRTNPAAISAGSSAKLRSIATSPAVTRARQVPQTPPLQANGRSARVAWAESRMDWSRGSALVADRPSRTMVTSLVLARRNRIGAPHLRRRLVDVEQLDVHLLARYAELGEYVPRAGDHRQRPAQPHVVDVVGWRQGPQEDAQPAGVEPAGQQIDVAGLAAEHVHELEPAG